jgi:hypothetical protein
MFSNRQIKQADLARKLYRMLGRPDNSTFQSILRNNLINNCPITLDDAHRALAIYGPDVAALKGKTTRTTAAPRAPTFAAVPLPSTVLAHHQNVTLCVDFFLVQGLCFLHTISRDIGFRTVAPVSDRARDTILVTELRAVVSFLYAARGFLVRDIHADAEFDCVRHALLPVHFNIVAADGHVGEIERSVRTIKERLRSSVHGLPYRRLPKLVIRRLVIDVVGCLNLFPWRNGISDHLSPTAIVTGQARPDYASMRMIEFGAYAQVFDDHTPTNTPYARTLGAIALDPTGNAQGAYHFMSLATGALISRHRWTELPIPDMSIARVEALALHDSQPLLQDRNLVVEWRPDHPINDSEYDLDFLPNNAEPAEPALDAADFDPVDADELAALADPFYDAPQVIPPAAQGALPIPDNDDDNDAYDDHAYPADGAANNPDPAHVIAPHDTVTDDDDDYDAGTAEDDDNGAPLEEQDDEAPDQGAHPDEAQDQGAQLDEGAPDTDTPATAHTYNLRERGSRNVTFREAMDNPHSGKSYYTNEHQLLQDSLLNDAPTQHAPAPQTDNARFAMDFVLAHVTKSAKQDAGIKKTQMSFRQGLQRYGHRAEAALMKEFAQLEDLNVYEAVDVRSITSEQRRAALRAINLIKEKRSGEIKGRTVADGSQERSLYDKTETASPTIASDALMLSIIIDAHECRDVATADIAGATSRPT